MRIPLLTLAIVALAGFSHAAEVKYQFTGTTSSTMSVNNGTSTGSIPAGTSYSGTLTFDDAQTATPAAFYGGSHSVYTYTNMSFKVGPTTLTWGPGRIDVYDNVTSTAGGYPIGDSFYANISAPVPPGGTIAGAQFNYIFLGFVDGTGTAFTGSGIPQNMNLASFRNPFVEFNYGTLGTPWGAGNTSTLQFLSTLSKTSATPVPPPTITTTALPAGTYGVGYTAPITASAPAGDAVTLSVSGLPTGLSFDGTSIGGTPFAIGTFNVSITATDSVTNLSTTSTLPLNINNAAISFTPALPDGVVSTPYSAILTGATGGSGGFSYSATGLPQGLALSGNTVSGTPTLAGVYNVALTATDSAGFSATANLTVTISGAATCSGKNAVISAYVARDPGFIVINGGLNLLDHLWTSNLNASNTLFLGGLANWYQTGLIVDYTGIADAAGCILTNLTVKPAVTIDTASLPAGAVGVPYLAPMTVSWGVAPYNTTASGLPSGLRYNGSDVTGTPLASGTFSVVFTVVDAVGATSTKSLGLTITNPNANYNIQDEGKGKITAVGSDYLMVGAKKLIWGTSTKIIVNTPGGELNIIGSFVQVGMKVQWKGLRDAPSNTVLTTKLEVN